jgi:diaminohydroxyphosphoribosylaminopyrimidine deaminase/5-amino-6-(5-phosphoribosylamino)uracil reductase
VFIAPIIIGGQAMTPVAGLGVESLAEAYLLERVTVARYGPDVMVQGYINPTTG